MARSLFQLSQAQFGNTKHNYVKASATGATITRAVTAPAAVAGATLAGGGFANAINAAARVLATQLSKNTNASNFINVCDDFDWTISPHGGSDSSIKKRLIPRAEINEFRLDDTAVIAALTYAAEGAEAAAGGVVEQAARGLKSAGFDGTSQGMQGAANVLNDVTKNAATSVRKKAGINANTNFPTTDWMKPYKDLYALQSTGFKYLLPYLDDQALNSLRPLWEDLSYPLSNALDAKASAVTSVAKISAPGQYIEKPKMFNPSQSGSPEATFKFPLFNTQSYEQACANYQLLWLLIFQNTPQRITKSLLEMPKVYSVNVPGVCYMQYSYIENLQVKFVGNRRHVDITMPDNSVGLQTSIPAIMPDAYDVEITFRSLNITNSNMLLEMWNQSKPQNLAF